MISNNDCNYSIKDESKPQKQQRGTDRQRETVSAPKEPRGTFLLACPGREYRGGGKLNYFILLRLLLPNEITIIE
jgi:hypothetical protein